MEQTTVQSIPSNIIENYTHLNYYYCDKCKHIPNLKLNKDNNTVKISCDNCGKEDLPSLTQFINDINKNKKNPSCSNTQHGNKNGEYFCTVCKKWMCKYCKVFHDQINNHIVIQSDGMEMSSRCEENECDNNIKNILESWSVCAYLCGDQHKTKKSYVQGSKPIPCYVCPKESADNSDDYSDTGFLYYSWNLENGKVEAKRLMYKNNSFEEITSLEDDEFPLSTKTSKTNLQPVPMEAKKTQSSPKPIKTRDVGQLLSTNPYSRDFKCEYPELFYEYSDEKITQKCVKIECQTYAGIDILRPITEYVYSQNCNGEKSLDNWIQQYWVNDSEKRIHLLSGYAGCGKSTFVLHQIEKNGLNAHVITFMDARQQLQEATTSEADILLKNLLNDLCIKMIYYHTSGNTLAKCINKLCENIERWGYKLTNDGYAYKEEIKNYFFDISSEISKSPKLKGISLEIDKLINGWREKLLQVKPFDESYNKKCSDCIPLALSMLVLWYHTMSQLETAGSSENHIWLVFDNLDEFDDKQQIVDLIMHVNTVLQNYYRFCPSDELFYNQPIIYIDAIFTCRTFTLADLLNKEGGSIDKTYLTQICISNLYSVSEVMKYKANGIVSSSRVKEKLGVNSSNISQLTTISSFPELFFKYIDSTDESDAVSFSRIINHNLRSTAAVFKKFTEDSFFYDEKTRNNLTHLLEKTSENKTIDRRLNGYLINRLSYYLLDVWSDMGYGTNTLKPKNLTTLSRLILTALFRKKKADDNNPQYSLKELYDELKWIPISKDPSPESDDLPKELFADTIARMLTRNISNGDMTPDSFIWRRPIMFHKNVISVTGTRERSERVKRYKEKIIEQINSPNIDCAEIVITDCGEEFIASYAIHFEFNSARFNPSYGPLWTISDYNEMDAVINGVYTEVRNCMIKQKYLAEAFRTKKPNDKYLSEEIHPLTNSFSTSPRPQPHILRVIFEHIAYLEYIRKTLWEEATNKKEVTDEIR